MPISAELRRYVDFSAYFPSEMNKVELGDLLRHTTYVVKAYDEGHEYSEGSGFCIRPDGLLVTAAHVVTGRTPIQEEDYRDPEPVLRARTRESDYTEYRPVLCGIKIAFPWPLEEPLQIDLALLAPIEKQTGLPHLPVSDEFHPVGSDVLMAGFPDEVELPLRFDKKLDMDYEPHQEREEETKKGLERIKELLMVKSGMVSHMHDLIINPGGSQDCKLSLASYYIDNAMHSGASGGPVINNQGEVIGVITKRAVTTVSYPDLDDPNKEVPSGSALAISASTLLDFVDRQISRGEIHHRNEST